MTFTRLLKLIVKAPVISVGCAIIGILFAGLLVLANGLIHLAAGIEHGAVSQLFVAVAKYLPLLFGVGGFLSAFMTNAPIPAVFGSARWATTKELQTLSVTDTGLLIGRDPVTTKLLRYDGPAHLLTMAPTRTGKGVGTIIPNLLTAERSVICIDPKGENAKVTGRARAKFGPVHILDPFGVTGQRSAAFNPSIRSIRTALTSPRTQARLPTRSSSMNPAWRGKRIGTRRPRRSLPG